MTEQKWNLMLQRGRAYKFIAPKGEWKCYLCLESFENLEIVRETRHDIFLICAFCESDDYEQNQLEPLLF